MDHPVSIPIKKIIQETEHVKTFVFEHQLGSKPGQFIMLWIPGVDAKPFSVAYDNGKEFWVSFYKVGPATEALAKFNEGYLVGIMGPYWTHYKYKKGEHLALIAGGYGAAPMYSVAKEASEAGCKLDFIVGARSEKDLLYLELIEKLDNTTLHIATDDGSRGHEGYNTQVLEEILEKEKVDWIFTCGPEMMMKRVSDIAHEKGIRAQLSLERYMKCGFGVCGNCVIDDLGTRLCKEGVVINNDLARRIKDFGQYHRDALGRKRYL